MGSPHRAALVHHWVGRITDVFTLGPRFGWAAGNLMLYVTGWWAIEDGPMADTLAAGWIANSRPMRWASRIGHIDLGSVTEQDFSPAAVPVERVRLRGHWSCSGGGGLVVSPRPEYAPLR
jgi:hypothetical protein